MDSSILNEEKEESRFWKKIKKDPVVPIGLVGIVAVVLVGATKFRNRGDTKTSIYLIHLRLAAQGTLLSFLTLGLGYTLWDKHLHKYFQNKK